MSNYLIKKLEKNQFDLLIPLMKDCFGMDVNVDYFKWKFLNNPAGSFIGSIAVEEDTGEVAAYYGAIPEKYFVEGKEKTIYQSCDTMTHSKHRRKGLFQKLAIHLYESLRENNELFIIGFGGAQSAPGLAKFGWRKLVDFRTIFIPKLLCQTFRFTRFDESQFEEITDLTELDTLFKNDVQASVFSNRSAEHAAWRYQNPLKKTKVIAFRPKIEIEGFVGYSIVEEKIFLFDFQFKTKSSGKILINYLKRMVVRQNLKGMIAFCAENSVAHLKLKSNGFIANPFNRGPLHERNPFMFYADEETMNRLYKPELWHITSYDHDSL